jgi:hypothetical protein
MPAASVTGHDQGLPTLLSAPCHLASPADSSDGQLTRPSGTSHAPARGFETTSLCAFTEIPLRDVVRDISMFATLPHGAYSLESGSLPDQMMARRGGVVIIVRNCFSGTAGVAIPQLPCCHRLARSVRPRSKAVPGRRGPCGRAHLGSGRILVAIGLSPWQRPVTPAAGATATPCSTGQGRILVWRSSGA